MSARAARAGVSVLVLTALTAASAHAQQTPVDPRATSGDTGATWLERVSVSARVGELRPSGRSELFSLMDDALAPSSDALRPALVGGALHLRVVGEWGLLLGAEAGESTVATVSRVQPSPSEGDVRQQTTLELTAVWYLGAEWRALRWRGAGPEAPDRLRLVLGAGGGIARYRLRQRGEFVDAQRQVVFEDDFSSAGRGAFGYASVGVEVPLHRWIALQGELRRQAGSAPMSADYAGFDRLDLGGTTFSAGLRIHPAGRGRGR